MKYRLMTIAWIGVLVAPGARGISPVVFTATETGNHGQLRASGPWGDNAICDVLGKENQPSDIYDGELIRTVKLYRTQGNDYEADYVMTGALRYVWPVCYRGDISRIYGLVRGGMDVGPWYPPVVIGPDLTVGEERSIRIPASVSGYYRGKVAVEVTRDEYADSYDWTWDPAMNVMGTVRGERPGTYRVMLNMRLTQD